MSKRKDFLAMLDGMKEDHLTALRQINGPPPDLQFMVQMRIHALGFAVQAHNDYGLKDGNEPITAMAARFMEFLQTGK